jgi:YesN/AraC family two-component response regulator
MVKKVILCVDDEPIILKSLVRLFRTENYDIYTANNGSEALTIFSGVYVDLIISDYRMPEMNGVELLQKVKDIYPGTVRIILSGFADFNNVVSAINDGQIYRFCHKPWENEELKITVRQSLEYHDLQKEKRILLRRIQKQNLELQTNNNFLEKKNKSNIVSMKVYQNILQKLLVPVIATDTTGKILLANNAALNLFPTLRENVRRTHIKTIFNEDTVTYILSLLKLDDSVNITTVAFEFEKQHYLIQVEQFELSKTVKGGILVLTPSKLT